MGRSRVVPLAIAYALLAAFVLVERLLRRGAEGVSLAAGPSDQGTTRALGRAFGQSLLAVLAAPLLNRLHLGRVRRSGLPWGGLPWGGLVAMLAGLGLRVWAARVLGASYTRTLRTGATQTLVGEGPYRLVRHPGYLGTLLLWGGAGLASANALVLAVIALAMGRAYRQRIRREEALLAERFGADYAAYRRRTWRLLPGLY